MLKVVFATTDGTAVDQHFGWCRRFDVYQIDGSHAERTEIRRLPAADGPVAEPQSSEPAAAFSAGSTGSEPAAAFSPDSAAAEHLGKIDGRLDVVRDCAILHICAIGAGAAARVVNAGIMPVKVPEGTLVTDLLTRLQAVIEGTPPPWLRKAMLRHDTATPSWSPR